MSQIGNYEISYYILKLAKTIGEGTFGKVKEGIHKITS